MAPGLDKFQSIIRSCIVFGQSSCLVNFNALLSSSVQLSIVCLQGTSQYGSVTVMDDNYCLQPATDSDATHGIQVTKSKSTLKTSTIARSYKRCPGIHLSKGLRRIKSFIFRGISDTLTNSCIPRPTKCILRISRHLCDNSLNIC